MKKIKIGLLSGGSSPEKNVSFMTRQKILESINFEKYEILEIEIPNSKDKQWVKTLVDSKPDIVLSALHGGKGENGAVQGLLECLEIPYIGSKVLGSAIGMDKCLSKEIMRASYIPVADDFFIRKEENHLLLVDKIIHMGFPLVVKPNLGGSSIGISFVDSKKELISAIEIVKNMNDDVLVEKFIHGREVTCGIVEKNSELFVMSVLDITTTEGFYDYKARYEDDRSLIYFSTLPEFLQTMIQEIAKKVFKVLRCSGYARVDMIVCEEQVYVLEINTLPGMTHRSLIPKAIEGKGDAFQDFLDCLIQEELKK